MRRYSKMFFCIFEISFVLHAIGVVLVSLLLTIVNFWIYFVPCSSVSIVTFEHVIAGWDMRKNWKI